MVGELGHVKQIVGDAPHDGAHLGVVVVGVIQLQQMVKGIPAHIRFDMHTHDMTDAGHIVAGCAVDDAQHKVERRQLQHDARRQGDAHPHGRVCDGAHDLGQHDIAQGRQRCAEQIKAQHHLIVCQIRQKTPDQRTAACVVRPGVVGFGFRHGSSVFVDFHQAFPIQGVADIFQRARPLRHGFAVPPLPKGEALAKR